MREPTRRRVPGAESDLSALFFRMKTATAIVLAGGAGVRMGGDPPKAYQLLAGRPMLLRTLDRLFAASSVDAVIIVAAADQMERCRGLLESDHILSRRRWLLQGGGATRQQSASKGLEKIDASCELVIIHDAARPFVSPILIDRCVEAAATKGAVVVGQPVRDTIKEVSPDRWIRRTPERSGLWEVQTPQVFQRDIIVRAYQQAERDRITATDDAMIVERLGVPVYMLDGERTNFKVTVPDDLWLAELMIREGRIPG